MSAKRLAIVDALNEADHERAIHGKAFRIIGMTFRAKRWGRRSRRSATQPLALAPEDSTEQPADAEDAAKAEPPMVVSTSEPQSNAEIRSEVLMSVSTATAATSSLSPASTSPQGTAAAWLTRNMRDCGRRSYDSGIAALTTHSLEDETHEDYSAPFPTPNSPSKCTNDGIKDSASAPVPQPSPQLAAPEIHRTSPLARCGLAVPAGVALSSSPNHSPSHSPSQAGCAALARARNPTSRSFRLGHSSTWTNSRIAVPMTEPSSAGDREASPDRRG